MHIGVNALFMIPGEVGGSETYLRCTLRALATLSPAPRLTVFTNDDNRTPLAMDLARCSHVDFVHSGVGALNRVARIRCEQQWLPRAVVQSGIDVLWSPGYTAPLRCSVPRLTSILDMQFRRFPKDFSFPELLATWLLVGLGARRSERLATISEFARREVMRFTGIDANRVHVTPLAVDAAFAAPLPGAVLAESVVRLTNGPDPYLLAVSNTYPHKDMATAVRAFGLLAADIPHRLVLVGQPRSGEAAVRAALGALPCRERVVRLAGLDPKDLIALYQAADAFVFPSRYEGFGLPVLEALAAGVPVVAAEAGAVVEVAGAAARYHALGDAAGLAAGVSEVLALHPDARRRVVLRGRERAAGFTWKRTASLTLAACERAAASE